MTNIFKFSNIQIFLIQIFIQIFVRIIFWIRIHSDIHSCHFLDTNIFGYSFVSKSIRMSHSGLVDIVVNSVTNTSDYTIPLGAKISI